jgi:TRAP-type C4-dicarboxylate transport system permease small subunit
VAKETPASTYRNERLLAFMALGIVLISILLIFTVLIAAGAGLTPTQSQEGVWPTIRVFPLIGLPIGFVLILVLLVTNMRRRSREARQEMEAERQSQRGSKPTKAQATVAKKASATKASSKASRTTR